jgi:hypothetical protein
VRVLTARRNGSSFGAIGGYQGATTPPPFPSSLDALQNGPAAVKGAPVFGAP